MATTHLKDVVAVVDTYQDNQGNEKKRYKNIGKLLRNDKGDFLVLDRTFNLAGCPGQGDVFVSLFDPKPRDGQQRQSGGGYDQSPPDSGYGGSQQRDGNRDLDMDDVPF